MEEGIKSVLIPWLTSALGAVRNPHSKLLLGKIINEALYTEAAYEPALPRRKKNCEEHLKWKQSEIEPAHQTYC